MRRALLCGILLSMTGCAAFTNFAENRRRWLAYVNSPEYGKRYYYSTYQNTTSGGGASCTMVCDRYECETRCSSY